MPADDFPYLKDGDGLTPSHFNVIYDELARWRKLSAAAPLVVDGAEGDDAPLVYDSSDHPFFMQLTGTYASGYPWVEVLIGAGRAVQTTAITGGPTTGNPAYERQTGDTTLTADGTVYEARWGPGGSITFDGKN